MKLIIISSSPFINKDSNFYAYSPYTKELNIWAKYSDEVSFSCPIWKNDNGLLISKINFQLNDLFELKEFNVKSIKNSFLAIKYSFINLIIIYKAMVWADHIHLRCPGNVGLLACFVQILFPKKIKTVKYAGNWDLKAKQPLSYRVQKWILNNTFLTKNMTVLVYGEWKNSSKNIKPFFTASYSEKEKTDLREKNLDEKVKLLFVGSLTESKNPFYAIKIVEKLKTNGFDVDLSICGNGAEYKNLENYIEKNNLSDFIYLKGNKNQDEIKEEYLKSHFVILPSKSEGWPKVVAEGMFWGCLPIATNVSCVPNMLDNGKRGILLTMNLDNDVNQIHEIISNNQSYQSKVENAIVWSRKYTLEYFEEEIKKLLTK